jgi:hypothetical protein
VAVSPYIAVSDDSDGTGMPGPSLTKVCRIHKMGRLQSHHSP